MNTQTTRRATARFARALFAVTLSAGALQSPGAAQAATVTVAAENYEFAPASRTIMAGDVVRWTFSGDAHSATSRDGLFDSGIKDAGGSFQFKFEKAGTFRYYCVVHPDLMSGTIVVKTASPTPRPTVRPTVKPTPKPTVGATATPASTPTSAPRPTTPVASSSPSPTPSASVTPSEPAEGSVAVLATPGPSSIAASPAPGSATPSSATGAAPIMGAVALLVVLVVGGLLLARRRRPV